MHELPRRSTSRPAALIATSAIAVIVLAVCGGDRRSPDQTAGDGAAVAAGSQPGEYARTLDYEGTERTFRLYRPDSAAGRPPLVIALHGGLGSGSQFADNSQFDRQADRYGFVMAYPDGLSFGTVAGIQARTWNGGRCCGQSTARDVDDSGFLAALIEELAMREGVDRSRVFVMGHSNGAMMALRFACEHSDLVRGAAAVAGSLEIPACGPGRAVSLLAIHGDADQNHPMDGGTGPRSIAGVPFNSMDWSLATWAAAMGCDPVPSVERSGPLSTRTWGNCRDGTTTRLVIIAGADHPWPGSTPQSTALQGRPSDALHASRAIAEFFAELAGLPAR